MPGSSPRGAGVTIGELLEPLVPAGWMVPVVPGTQHVSVGGAIASDVHGKNHGVAGTFGSHVGSIGLFTAAGEEVTLGPEDELFQATLGGMGLTGVILWARVRLAPVRARSCRSTPTASPTSTRLWPRWRAGRRATGSRGSTCWARPAGAES